jgi:hypothetical protein
MRIGIDISQIVYEGTGVARYVRSLVEHLVQVDKENEYVLFAATLRRRHVIQDYFSQLSRINSHIKLFVIPIPPILLDLLWNRLHIIPVEWLIGDVQVFWSSDWTQPPLLNARGVTTVYDLVYLKFPQETNPKSHFSIFNLRISPNIVKTQRNRMKWVFKECFRIITDSISTKNDLVTEFHADPEKITVVYPGFQ